MMINRRIDSSALSTFHILHLAAEGELWLRRHGRGARLLGGQGWPLDEGVHRVVEGLHFEHCLAILYLETCIQVEVLSPEADLRPRPLYAVS
jgi:hypothetical protein